MTLKMEKFTSNKNCNFAVKCLLNVKNRWSKIKLYRIVSNFVEFEFNFIIKILGTSSFFTSLT